MNQEKVGKFIKELRKSNKLTQAAFAEKYGVTYQAVSNWEQGKNLPDILLLKQISKDFNVSIDDLLEGKKITTKSNKTLYIIILGIIAIILIIVLILIINLNKDSYEFKTLSSNCDNFNISGSLSYDSKKTSIFISNVNYCGGDDKKEYTNIECILYESNGRTEAKISSSKFSGNKSQKLEEFLKNVKFTVNDYTRSCKIYTNNNLYLRIYATLENGNITTYKIPLKLNEDCDN